MIAPRGKALGKQTKGKVTSQLPKLRREEILVNDAYVDGKKFRTPAPILARIKARKNVRTGG